MNDAFHWTIVHSREYLQCAPLAARAPHLFSTRQLELPADRALRRKNIELFASDLGVEPERLLRVRQVHGSTVLVADGARHVDPGLADADAIVSVEPGTACSVQVADCVPILIAGRHAVAAVHAGWRGTAAGVAAEAVRALARLGAGSGAGRWGPASDRARRGAGDPAEDEDASTLVAALGPSIGPCCYQVDARVRDVFAQSPYAAAAEDAFTPDGEGHWRLDVPRINRRILEQAGVPASQIHESGLCTACDLTRFYSYRAEGAATGRLIAGILVA